MKMIFETPATVWQEAFPLGNGRIGALMFGDGEAETLCLNEDTLWSGYPGIRAQVWDMRISKSRSVCKRGEVSSGCTGAKSGTGDGRGCRDV